MCHVTNNVVGTNLFSLSKANVIKGMHFRASVCCLSTGDVKLWTLLYYCCMYVHCTIFIFPNKSHYPSVCLEISTSICRVSIANNLYVQYMHVREICWWSTVKLYTACYLGLNIMCRQRRYESVTCPSKLLSHHFYSHRLYIVNLDGYFQGWTSWIPAPIRSEWDKLEKLQWLS